MGNDAVIKNAEQLGLRVNGHPEHVADVVPQLLALLDQHREPTVLAAIVGALGLASDENASPRVLPLVDRADASVRLAVAQTLRRGSKPRTASTGRRAH